MPGVQSPEDALALLEQQPSASHSWGDWEEACLLVEELLEGGTGITDLAPGLEPIERLGPGRMGIVVIAALTVIEDDRSTFPHGVTCGCPPSTSSSARASSS